MKLGPVVVNNVDGLDAAVVPDPATVDLDGEPSAAVLAAAAEFRRARRAVQDTEIARLDEQLALEQWHLPMLPVAGLAAADVAVLSPLDPAAVVTRSESPTLDDVLDGAEVVVCCGSGGVGKTTTAAVIGSGGGSSRPPGRRRDDRSGPPPRRRARPPRRPRRRPAGDRPAGRQASRASCGR